jgi:hypothetical protein
LTDSRVIEPPKLDVKSFPYRRKWTEAELDGVYARFEKIRTVLTDVVGPSGQIVYIDPGMVAILALHAALAGTDVDDELAFIEHRIRSDDYGLFQDVHEWRVKGEFHPDDKPEDPAVAKAKAAELREQLRKEVAPDILSALRQQLAEEFDAETTKTKRRGKRVSKEG